MRKCYKTSMKDAIKKRATIRELLEKSTVRQQTELAKTEERMLPECMTNCDSHMSK